MTGSALLNIVIYAAGALAIAIMFAIFYPAVVGVPSEVSYLDALLYVVVGRVATMEASQ